MLGCKFFFYFLHPSRLWANGVVPYIYDSTFLSIDRQAFEKAIDYVESKTCVKFKTRTSESDYML